jgi:transglutaminase-like putative cysteine protease
MNQPPTWFATPLVALAALLVLPDPAKAEPPEYVLTANPARRVEAVQTFDITYPKFTASEWIVLAAAAPELPSQQTVSTQLSLEGKAGSDLSQLKRPIVWAKVAAGAKQQSRFRYAVTYQATLLQRRLTSRPKRKKSAQVDPLKPEEKKWYLAPTAKFYDYDAKPFQAWLDRHGLRIKATEGEVDFARRVFLVIADTCSYEARQDADLQASAVCRAGKSDCCGLSVLFVAALRANGVPARSLVGNWAESARPGQIIGDILFTQQHVRAEFFAAGVGWVPADPSGALRWKGWRWAMLQQGFGSDAGNFLVKQVDFDLVFDSGAFGQQTVVWAWGTAWPIGQGDRSGWTVKDDWKVRQIRAHESSSSEGKEDGVNH